MSQPLVLVVDDEEDIRDSLVEYLRRAMDGISVLGASGAHEAQQMLRLSHVDLILTDHFMPDGPGTDVLRFAYQNNPKTQRMLMTAFPESEVLIKACNEAHVHHIFTKPFDPPGVATRIVAALESAGVYGASKPPVQPTR